MNIPIEQIRPNAKNTFRMVDIEKLAESIREYGLQHNLVVRPYNNPEESQYKYEIISGERRYRAVKMLGWQSVPCKIDEAIAENDIEAEIKLIITNFETRELDPIEKGNNVIRLEELIKIKREQGADFGGKKTRDVVAEIMGEAPAQVQKLKKVQQDLIPEIKELVKNGDVPLETANQYAQMEPEQQMLVYKALQEGLKLGHKEAKELKNKLKQKEVEAEEVINKMKIMESEIAQKENLLKKMKMELDKVQAEAKKKETDAEELKERLKAELNSEIEKEGDSEKVKELERKLQEASENLNKIKGEEAEKIAKLEDQIKSLEEENISLINDYEKRLEEKENAPIILKENIEANSEILAIARQVQSSMITLLGRIGHHMRNENFILSDEAKEVLIRIIDTGNLIEGDIKK